MDDKIINKVSLSGLVTVDLEEIYPKGERITFDIKTLLFEELVLREKDFREFVLKENWSSYKDKYVALICSSDAIVPTWAYMILASHLEPFVRRVVFGSLETLETILFNEALRKLNFSDYTDMRIVIKGCGKAQVPKSAYVELTRLLRPIAKSIMYGEPCSTVPVYKKTFNLR